MSFTFPRRSLSRDFSFLITTSEGIARVKLRHVRFPVKKLQLDEGARQRRERLRPEFPVRREQWHHQIVFALLHILVEAGNLARIRTVSVLSARMKAMVSNQPLRNCRTVSGSVPDHSVGSIDGVGQEDAYDIIGSQDQQSALFLLGKLQADSRILDHRVDLAGPERRDLGGEAVADRDRGDVVLGSNRGCAPTPAPASW